MLCSLKPYGMQNVVAKRSAAFSAAISHNETGSRISVSTGRWGPCCSIAPAGIRTTLSCRTASFTSGHVILPRFVMEFYSKPGSFRHDGTTAHVLDLGSRKCRA